MVTRGSIWNLSLSPVACLALIAARRLPWPSVSEPLPAPLDLGALGVTPIPHCPAGPPCSDPAVFGHREDCAG